MTDPCQATVAGLQAAIASGATSRADVVAAHLDRIERVNLLTHSFAEVRAADALAEARKADEEHGRTLAGPLDGVPMSIKDSFAVRGLRRTDGLPVHADRIAAADDVVVTRLRDAGTLVVGHGNVPDLCIRWNTVSGLYGATRNPRDLSRTVGGSSGGDAANVAAGLATVALGQDLGGSIRVPASFCGVYGLRTSAGVVPNVPVIPAFPASMTVDAMGTFGPFGRSVADLAAVLQVIAGPHPYDPVSVPAPLIRSARPLRVAVLRTETGAVLEQEIERRLDATVVALQEAGHDVVEAVFPDLRRAPEVWAEIIGTDLLNVTMPDVGHLVTDSGRVHIEEMFGLFDLGPDVRRYGAAWLERRALQDRLVRFLEEFPLVVAPVAGMPTPPLGFDDHIGSAASGELFDRMRCVVWVNLFGLPALALPNGIQLVTRRFHEPDLLATAAAIEPLLPPVEIADPVGGRERRKPARSASDE
jgi:amidase